MADPPRSPGTEKNARQGPDPEATSTPRWVFVLGIIIAIALVGLIILLHVSGTLGPGAH